jgi:protein TonB
VPPQPIVAELVTLETLQEPAPVEAESPPRQDIHSGAPLLPVVAAPSPAIPFALPVEGLVRIGSAAEAIPSAPTSVVQRLTFGEGEGKQPQPEYPIEAQLAGQEGTVVVRFTIGPDGRVSDARAISPCNWPLLNQAAVRSVRDTWRFSPGPVRLREVSIQYQSKQ